MPQTLTREHLTWVRESFKQHYSLGIFSSQLFEFDVRFIFVQCFGKWVSSHFSSKKPKKLWQTFFSLFSSGCNPVNLFQTKAFELELHKYISQQHLIYFGTLILNYKIQHVDLGHLKLYLLFYIVDFHSALAFLDRDLRSED